MPEVKETAESNAISERNKSQASEERLGHQLYQSEQWLRMLIDSAEDYAIFAVSPEGKICTWNKGAQSLFGYSEQEILGKDFALIFTPEDREQGAPKQEVETALQRGYCPDDRWHLRKDGSRLFVSGSVRPLRDSHNKVHGFLKVAHDITKNKDTEELQSQFRALFESAPGLYLVLEPKELRIVAASDAYLKATMTEREKVVGRLLFDAFPVAPSNSTRDSERNLRASYERVIREGRQDVLPVQYYPIPRPASKGGGFEERWWSPINTPVFGKNGEVTHIIHRVEDVTPFVRRMQSEDGSVREMNEVDRRLQQMAQEIILRGEELKRANLELRQSRVEMSRLNAELEDRVRERTARLVEKVHELEGFSYSLSHDLRAPLRAMMGFAQILQWDFSARVGPEGAELLERIVTAAARLDQLIRDVLALSRLGGEQIQMKPVDLEKLLRQIIREHAAFQPPHTEIQIAGPLPVIVGHEASLSQCFSNLLDNAVKFVSPGVLPRVLIRAEIRGDRVRVWVEDNGIGIPTKYSEQIFEMFERLHGRERYVGTGIGLAIVRKAVERMGGKVGVESEEGKGSRFWIELPKG